MKTLLITRPQADAEALARMLQERGFTSLTQPMLHIELLPEHKPQLDAALAQEPGLLIATSRHAVTALADMTQERNIPLFCVGTATAHYAESLGYKVSGYSETAHELVKHMDTQPFDRNRPLLYARGEDITMDLAGALTANGLKVDSVTLYRAAPAEAFSAELQSAITKGALAGALFFSPRTADIYARLARKHGLMEAHESMHALCISQAAAAQLNDMRWQNVHIAQKPSLEAMLELAEAL